MMLCQTSDMRIGRRPGRTGTSQKEGREPIRGRQRSIFRENQGKGRSRKPRWVPFDKVQKCLMVHSNGVTWGPDTARFP